MAFAKLRASLVEFRPGISRPTAILLGPLLLRQGRQVRARTVLLPEAAGDRSGAEGRSDERLLRLAVIGESTAAGVGAADQRDALPHQLAVELAARQQAHVSWTVAARTGATVGHTLRRLLPDLPRHLDLVVVVLGVNDSMKLTPRRPWRSQICTLIETLQTEYLDPDGQILVTGIPDLGRFGTLPQPLRAVLGWHARALDRDLVAIAARSPGVRHVPMPGLTWPDMFAVDGFHPNVAAYQAWARHLAAAA